MPHVPLHACGEHFVVGPEPLRARLDLQSMRGRGRDRQEMWARRTACHWVRGKPSRCPDRVSAGQDLQRVVVAGLNPRPFALALTRQDNSRIELAERAAGDWWPHRNGSRPHRTDGRGRGRAGFGCHAARSRPPSARASRHGPRSLRPLPDAATAPGTGERPACRKVPSSGRIHGTWQRDPRPAI
jgi:hypothetical protein